MRSKATYRGRPRPQKIILELDSKVIVMSLPDARQLRDTLTDALNTPRCLECGLAMPEGADWVLVPALDDPCCDDWCCPACARRRES